MAHANANFRFTRYAGVSAIRFTQTDFSVTTAVEHVSSALGYLRRSKITTWARERSSPINVKVTMKTSGRMSPRRPISHANVLPDEELKVVELVALSAFYAHHLSMQILDGKNHAGGRYERLVRDMILAFLNGEETR